MSKTPVEITNKSWGRWTLLKGENSLTYYHDGEDIDEDIGYGIFLEELTSSAQVLDTIMQVAGKKWATNECTAGLVRALDGILDCQANLCGCGDNKQVTSKWVKARVQDYIKASG